MTEKALLPSDDRTYGMERTSESEDRVETTYCDFHVTEVLRFSYFHELK